METRKMAAHLTGKLSTCLTTLSPKLRAWLPSRGNVIFTLVLMAILFYVQSAGAFGQRSSSILAEPTGSTGLIAYQGRLADSGGNPLTGMYTMVFRLYNQSAGGSPLWEEQRTGSNSVSISDGLFNVMLGSLTPIPQSLVEGNTQLYLGITVGNDDEMTPRVQVGSVLYARQALTVPDGSINSAKIADGSIQRIDLASNAIPPSIPVGTVISWWRADASTPLPSGEWAFADGSIVNDTASPLNGKTLPDLRNRFVMGVAGDQVGTIGGANTVDLSHSHGLPAHSHEVSGNTGEPITGDGGPYNRNNESRFANNTYVNTWYVAHHHSFDVWTSSWSGTSNVANLTLDNRPAYIGLVYLVKIK